MPNGNGKRTLKEKYQWITTTLMTLLTPLIILGLIWLVGVGNTQEFQAKEITELQTTNNKQEENVVSLREDVAVLNTKVEAIQETLKTTATKDDINSLKELMLLLDKKREVIK